MVVNSDTSGIGLATARAFARKGASAVSPGPADTTGRVELLGGGRQAQKARRALADQIPAGHVGRPEEVAAAVLFPASNAASFVDGGSAQI